MTDRTDEELRGILGNYKWRVHWWEFVSGWRHNAATELIYRQADEITDLKRRLEVSRRYARIAPFLT